MPDPQTTSQAPPTPATGPGGMPVPLNPDGTINIEAYNAYIQKLWDLQVATSGWQQTQAKAALDDAVAARNNALKIAQLQSDTSRYGTNATRQTEIERLQQNQRQFDATHAYDMQKLGIDSAKTATDYLSAPDHFFQGQDYINMAGRAMNGLAPAPYASNGAPTPNSMQNFAVLASGGNPYTSVAGTAGTNGAYGASLTGQGYTAPPATAAASGGASASSTPPDPRLAAVNAVMKAIPPSTDPGLNQNDYAVLGAVHQILTTNLQPGQWQRMSPGQQAITTSGAARLGYDPNDWINQQKRQAVSQGSARNY